MKRLINKIFFFAIFSNFSIYSLPFYEEKNLGEERSTDYNIKIKQIVTHLNHPWGLTFIDNDRFIITERYGVIWVYHNKELFKVVGLPENIYQHNQAGILDVLKVKNHYYLSYALRVSASEAVLSVVQFDLEEGKSLYSMVNKRLIFKSNGVAFNGIQLGSRITTDGQYLFISLGDGERREFAQDLSNDLGKIIRINLDGSIPEDNPFSQMKGARPEIYSYGHRNPQGLFYDSYNSTLWESEHGPQGGDELNIINAKKNYGWPVITYGVEYGTAKKIGEGTKKEGMEQPYRYWIPSPALSGLILYRGEMFKDWDNSLFLGALKFGSLYRLQLNDNNHIIKEEILLKDRIGRIRTIRATPTGSLYILTDEINGRLIELSL